MKVRIFFTLFLLCAFCAGVFAQSTANEIEELLAASAVTYAQAARFLLEASDSMITSDSGEAFRFAATQGWLPKGASPDGEARLDGISLLFMRSFDIKGGALYSITKSPHYAYREMTYQGFIQGRVDPTMNVSGEYVLFVTGRILAMYERTSALAAERELKRKLAEEAAARRAAARREALAAEINTKLVEHKIADTAAEATAQGVTITLSNIQFLPDSTEMPPSEIGKISEIAGIIKSLTGIKILVAGHAADTGARENELRISQARAEVVAALLVSHGALSKNNITAIGYGPDFPIADNSTEAGKAANRRVEITILE